MLRRVAFSCVTVHKEKNMAIRIAGALMTLSFVFALLTGKMEALSEAALIGSGKAVTVTLSLLGMMCLWGGLMRVAERAGLLRSLTRLLSPLLRRLFPDAAARGKGLTEISAALAANMLGISKCIIAFVNDGAYALMLNPKIVKFSGPYEAEEGCLSLLGGPRKTTRYQKIKVQYQTKELQTRLKTFEGWTAQIIQHEIDHCNGILI